MKLEEGPRQNLESSSKGAESDEAVPADTLLDQRGDGSATATN